MSAKDKQVGGSHYKDYAIQPVEFIQRNNLGFLEGCVIKRMCRWRAKNGIEDLRKAIHEIELLIEAQPEQDPAPAELPLRACDCQRADLWPDGSPAQCRCASMDATGPAPAANHDLPPMGARIEGPYPTQAPDGTRILAWRPRGQGLGGAELYGWVEIGFMWDGQLVPHEVAS